jgi:lysozyme
MLQNFLIMLLNLLQKAPKKEVKSLPKEEPKSPSPIPNPAIKNTPMKTSTQGVEMLVASEGFRSKPYLDTKGIPTIGYGSTFYEDGTKVTMADAEITKERALKLKMYVLKDFEDKVNGLVKVSLTQNQYDAIMNLVYNIGTGAFATSTLLKRLNEGKFQEAADQFLVWKRSGNDPDILLPRRKRERELFLRK